MASVAHLVFNAFAKNVVLLVRAHCSVSEKAVVKREFKIFDTYSPKYADHFADRVLRDADQDLRKVLVDETQIFTGVSWRRLKVVTPESDQGLLKCAVYGMLASASMVRESVNDDVCMSVLDAILSESIKSLEDVVMDTDLLYVICTAIGTGVPESVRSSLTKIKETRLPGQSVGLMQLAQEVSQGLDLTTLMGVAGQDDVDASAMNNLFASINQKVVQRMQDGSIDPAKLCAEATQILGAQKK